jgi:hypothetical protein
VAFNGDNLWHAITPLGEHEERVSLTLQYVTDPSMSAMKRLFSNLKDAFAYFGLKTVFTGRVRASQARLRTSQARLRTSQARLRRDG